MIFFRFLILNLALAVTFNLFAREKVLLDAEDDWAPYSSDSSGKLEGFAVELNKAIFQAVNVDVEFKTVSYARCIFDVKENTPTIGCFDTARNKSNESSFYWPDKPLFSEKVLIWVKKSSKMNGLTFEDLKGQRVGITNGYEYGTEFDSDDADIEKDIAVSDFDSFKKLEAGRLDYILAYDKPARNVLKSAESIRKEVRSAGVLATLNLYTSFSKQNPKSKHFLQLYNQGMKIVHENGTYDKLVAKLERQLK